MNSGGGACVAAVEQRLREAFMAAAQTVAADSIRDLPVTAGQPRDTWGGGARFQQETRPGRTAQWRDGTSEWPPRFRERVLVPLAAAAAVTLITVTMTVIVPALTAGGRSITPALGADVRRYHQALGGAAPAFFVGIRQLRTKVPEPAAATLAVYSAVSGKVVARLSPPGPGRWFQAVAALGSDGSFVAAASPGRGQDRCHTWLYRFSLGPLGRPGAVEPLAVPEVAGEIAYNSSLAASADGRIVAYATKDCTKALVGQIGVIHLATRTVTTWGTVFPANPRNLSLSADGAVLSLAGNPSSPGRAATPSADAAWTLRTRSASGPLVSLYQRVLAAKGGVQAAVLSPTASLLFALTATTARRAAEELSAYDTATGRMVRLVHRLASGTSAPGLSTDVSGRYALVYMLHLGVVQELNLATGQIRALRVGAAASPLAAAW